MLVWAGAINRYTNRTWHALLHPWEFNHYSGMNNPRLIVIKTWVKSHSCSHTVCKAINWTELKLYSQVCQVSQTPRDRQTFTWKSATCWTRSRRQGTDRFETHVDMLEYFTVGYSVLVVSEGCQFHIQIITHHFTKDIHVFSYYMIAYIRLLFNIS